MQRRNEGLSTHHLSDVQTSNTSGDKEDIHITYIYNPVAGPFFRDLSSKTKIERKKPAIPARPLLKRDLRPRHRGMRIPISPAIGTCIDWKKPHVGRKPETLGTWLLGEKKKGPGEFTKKGDSSSYYVVTQVTPVTPGDPRGPQGTPGDPGN